MENYFTELNNINVNGHTEQKNGLTLKNIFTFSKKYIIFKMRLGSLDPKA